MPYPSGLPLKTLTFGRYTTPLGANLSGSILVGFDKPMLHRPSGAVITSGMDSVIVNPVTGTMTVNVPVTENEDLVVDWHGSNPKWGQRLRVDIKIPGHRAIGQYITIRGDDPDVIDFDQLVVSSEAM